MRTCIAESLATTRVRPSRRALLGPQARATCRTAAAVFAAISVAGCGHSSTTSHANAPPASAKYRHAEVIALAAATGRIVWASTDLLNLADITRWSVDDTAQVITIVGVNLNRNQPCGIGQDAIVSFDLTSGQPRRPPHQPFVESEEPLTGPAQASDAASTYEVRLHDGADATIVGRSRTNGSVRWTRTFPDPHHVLRWATTAAVVAHRATLYVAIAEPGIPPPQPSDHCGGD